MAEQSTGDEDDWVKQMLAEAMLGRPMPPVDAPPVDASAPLPVGHGAPTPVVRYEVVLDEPVETEPVETESAETEPAETESVETEPADVEQLIDLEMPSPSDIAADGPSAADPVVVPEPARLLLPGDSDGTPAPASVNRLFERPSFDATHDPGVDEMLAAEHDEPVMAAEVGDRSRLRGGVEWVVVLGSAVVVALLLRAFLFQAFFIPSESMESTLLVDDRVLVNKLSYRFGDVERGEVVVFRRPEDQPGEFRDLIKRVIGMPGESIEARDNTIFIDGQALIEPYLTPGEVIGDFGPVIIPEGEFFVMGDNRDNSGDSRVFGPIEEERLTGRAFFVFWPLDRIGSL